MDPEDEFCIREREAERARQIDYDIGRDADEPPGSGKEDWRAEEYHRRADYEYERSMDR